MRLSPGKRKRLEAVSDSRGVIGALAIDQRDALRSLFSAELKIEKSVVPREQLEEFKSIAVRVLSPHASAVLLEPEYGLRAAGQRAPSVGLLMAYEVSGYDPKVPSRLPGLLEHWSVRRLVDAGAHCVKVLLYYALSDAPEIQERKRVWVERVGSECVLVSAMQEFSKPHYCVDVLKVGVPATMAYVEGSSASSGVFVHTRAEALELFRHAAAATGKPFLFLSAGVSNRVFNEALELASEAGVHFCGVLCGRATWKDGVSVFVRGGAGALQEWLQTQGVQNMRSINESLKAATPWWENYPADE